MDAGGIILDEQALDYCVKISWLALGLQQRHEMVMLMNDQRCDGFVFQRDTRDT